MIPTSPEHLNLGKPDWRPFQREALQGIAEASDKKYHALCAPTGSGKSLIALGLGRYLDERTIILTSTKALQDQYVRDFGIPKAIGRGNFRCAEEPSISAEDAWCTFSPGGDRGCPSRDRCAYLLQRNAALAAPISVLNYPMFLGLFNYGDLPSPELVICDEGHNLEKALIDFGTVEFADRELSADWRSWSRASDCAAWAKARARKLADKGTTNTLDADDRRLLRRLSSLLSVDNNGWVLQQFPRYVRVRPLWGSSVSDALFTHASRFLIMSATLMPATLEAAGLASEDWSWHDVPSTFPPENRPVYLWPVTAVNAKTSTEEYDELAYALDLIIAREMPAKGMIHMASGKLQERLLGLSKYGRIIRTHSTRDRLEVLDAFKQAQTGILSSPSMMEGIDMPDDLLRWQVIPKTPFADLGDPVVAARARDNPAWYTQDAISKMVQAAGRGVRHKEDRCSTWILDKHAWWLYARHAAWWPLSVRQAVVRIRR